MSRRHTCSYEADVLDLVAIEQWPQRANEHLRAHVSGCAVCGDLARVAQAVAGAAEAGRSEVHVPTASAVWHRAQARSRQERARQAVRPVTAVFVVFAICALAAAAGGWLFVRSSVRTWWESASPNWFTSLSDTAALRTGPAGVWTLPGWWTWMAAAVLVCSALLPVALYLARLVDREDQARPR